MRRLHALAINIAVVAVSGAVSGCGTSTPAITKAQATAYARAVNLQATDLSGMRLTAPERESTPSGDEAQLYRCAGKPNPGGHLVDLESATFAAPADGDIEQIHSSVEVSPTAAMAAERNAIQTGPRGLACIARLLPRLLDKEDGARVHYGPVTMEKLPDPLPEIEGSFDIRMNVPIEGVPVQIAATTPHLYVDVLGFVSGAAEVNLMEFSYPQPAQSETEQRLLSVLYERTKANAL